MDPVLNDAKKDDLLTSTLCPNRSVYVIVITSRLNTHYIRDNCDEGTWEAKSDSLNFDFIHGDIHTG